MVLPLQHLSLPSPLGMVTLSEAGGKIVALGWTGRGLDRTPLLIEAARQLTAYFAGGLQQFDLPLDAGLGFQAEVRQALCAIPYGRTETYGSLARRLKSSAQAVGQACGANPIPILIPCHRVLGQCGLGGFSAPGGVEAKVALLRLEGAGLLI